MRGNHTQTVMAWLSKIVMTFCRCWVVSVLTATCAFAAEDVIVLNNGDRLRGEIKKVDKGLLYFKTSYGDSDFVIDWLKVKEVESDAHFAIQLASGHRLSGSIHTSAEHPQELTISGPPSTNRAPRSEVVLIEPVSPEVWKRLDIAVDGGFSFTKANKTQSLTLGARAAYREERWAAEAKASAQQTVLQNGNPTRRNELSANYKRILFKEPWFYVGLANFLKNQEQRLDLRASYGAGIGRHVFRTNRSYLLLLGGAQYTKESYLDTDTPNKSSAEGFIYAELNQFNIGALDFLTSAKVTPSFSEAGRVRIDFNSDLKWDLPKDFYISIRFWNNFDSAPLNDAPKNDFGAVTGIGWEF